MPDQKPHSISQSLHKSIMVREILRVYEEYSLNPKTYMDGTFGRGGHLGHIYEKWPELNMVAVDLDQQALDYGASKYVDETKHGKIQFHQGRFTEYLERSEEPNFDLALLDLGVSSPQLDEAERGFSFYRKGPLDMRMDRSREIDAATVVNEWDEDDLIEVFKKYGEVRRPYKVVKAIVHDRQTKPFVTTTQLAEMIERVDRWTKKGKHPATNYFLGLRLYINQELETLEKGLDLLIQRLNPGGVAAVLSFHSLEDRIVKNCFKNNDFGKPIFKKVLIPEDDEQSENPRSRSAKLRFFLKKVDDEGI